jgi:hypothetical protein
MLKVICYLLSVSLIVTGCSDASSTTTANGIDSTKKDSSISVKAAQPKEEFNEEEDFKNYILEMTHICENPFTKDTVFTIGNDTFSVAVNHSCTGDSFQLPARYLTLVKGKPFTAHNLKTNIVIEKNGVSILDKRIEKEDFKAVSDEVLNQNAVLLYPILKQTGDSICIDYSLSIPLTDVGIGVRATILKDGSMNFGRN